MHSRFSTRVFIAGLLISSGLCFAEPPAGISIDPPQPTGSPLNRARRFATNREPAIPRLEQDQAAADKLSALQDAQGSQPNILWIIVDDMGYGDPGCYGGGIAVGSATPNMDKYAREGLRLTSCYSQQTCTPTRSAILTGRLPVRTGLTRPILAGDSITVNPWDGEACLAKVLSQAGYKTVLTGKWHCGEMEGMRPHEVGFDEYYGYYAAQKEISQGVDARRYPDLVNDSEKFAAFEELGIGRDLVYGVKGMPEPQVISTVKSTDDMGRADQVLADWTVAKIAELAVKENGVQKKPFFLEHCFMKVHCDNFDNPDLGALSASKYPYRNAIAEVDLHIGAIMEALDDAGVLENTFVFITSDNGPQMDAWPDAGYTPFRGAKGTTFEGGVRIPGIAYWKGTISPGRESDDVFDLMDLYNTAVNLADAQDEMNALTQRMYIDGVDQTSFLVCDDGLSKRDCVYFWWQYELMGVRLREYKQHIKVVLPQSTHKHIDLSLVHDVGLAPWLFNLYIDPKEKMSVGHRRNAWLASMGQELKAHTATFATYPAKDVGLSGDVTASDSTEETDDSAAADEAPAPRKRKRRK